MGEVVGGDVAAAEGAGGVLVKPLVDAVDVEGVLAFGEEAEDVDVIESREADGAFEAVAGASKRREAEEGEGLDDGLVDARGGEGAGAGEAVVDLAGVGVGGEGGGAVAELGVEEEDEGEGEHDGEHADHDGEAGLEVVHGGRGGGVGGVLGGGEGQGEEEDD